MNWFKQQAANVIGTSEPIHGPGAVQPVGKKQGAPQYTQLASSDLKWTVPSGTFVETQTFYIFSKEGNVAMVQVIYSHVGIMKTCQFNSKIFYPDGRESLWSTNQLEHPTFDSNKINFKSHKASIDQIENGTAYHIKSDVDEKSIVDLKITQKTPGYQAGNDGVTTFGTNPAAPWGTMKHLFWPRCVAEGVIKTKSGDVDFTGGQAMFIHALQGMKPHHAAARWNFVDFHTPTFSASMMEFTTPPSYGETVVNVGGVVKDGEIIYAGTTNTAKHTEIHKSTTDDWPAPSAADFKWQGTTADGKAFSAELIAPLGNYREKVDVMAEVPKFVKSTIGATVGIKPYIYQYIPSQRLKLKVVIDGQETIEEGTLFHESTFIS